MKTMEYAPIEYLNEVSRTVTQIYGSDFDMPVRYLKTAKNQTERTVYVVGNGGSAATASHFANDLVKMTGIRAISVPDATSTILAYGNDLGWNFMFSNYIAAVMRPMDVLVAISCSGRSKNVIEAARAAIVLDGNIIVLTGPRTGNDLIKLPYSFPAISIDHPDIRVVEDVHLAICHAIVGALIED